MSVQSQKISFQKVTEQEYLEFLEKTENYTFYNSAPRFAFLKTRGRTLNFYTVKNGSKVIGVVHYQRINARSMNSLYFQHTPLFIKDIPEDTRIAVFEEFFNFTKTLLEQENVPYARITPRIKKSKELLEKLYSLGYVRAPVQEIDASSSRIVDLTQFSIKDIRKTTRNCINAGLRLGLYTESTDNPKDFDDFMSFYTDMERTKGFTPLSKDYLVSELQEYQKAGMLKKYTTYQNKKQISIGIVITFGKNAYYYHASTSADGKSMNASHVNLYHIIEDLKSKGFESLDLWGGVLPEEAIEKKIKHPWENLDIFKRGFNAALVDFLPPLDIPRTKMSYLFPYWFQWFRTKRKGYPII